MWFSAGGGVDQKARTEWTHSRGSGLGSHPSRAPCSRTVGTFSVLGFFQHAVPCFVRLCIHAFFLPRRLPPHLANILFSLLRSILPEARPSPHPRHLPCSSCLSYAPAPPWCHCVLSAGLREPSLPSQSAVELLKVQIAGRGA